MNMYSLIEATKQTDLDAAIASANQWLVSARPVIKAMFALEDAEWSLRRECDDQVGGEAVTILRKPRHELRELVDGIRDNFLCDVTPSHVGFGDDDPRWDERDEFIDEVGRVVISVAEAIRIVGDEM